MNWLLIIFLVILLVWWAITRQTKYSPSIDEHASDDAHHAGEHVQEAEAPPHDVQAEGSPAPGR